MTLALTDDHGTERAIDAVLFDMDGTIVDSIEASERIWRAWALDHGVADQLEIAHGRPASVTVSSMLPHLTPEEHARALVEQQARETNDLDGVAATAGTLELLAWLDEQGVPWAVVTSADALLAHARLAASGIAPVEMVTIDDVEQGKPHPEPFLTGAGRLGIPVERCLVVEDTRAGVTSGRAAGAVTAGLGDLGADVRILDMHDLRGRLAPPP